MVLIPEVAFVSSVVLSMLGGHCAVCNSSLSPAARPVAFSRTIANTDSTCFDLVWICYTTNLQQFVLRRTHNANRQQNRKPETNPENNPTTCCPTNKRHIQVVEVWRNTDLPGFKISCKSVYGGFSANRWNIRKHFYLNIQCAAIGGPHYRNFNIFRTVQQFLHEIFSIYYGGNLPQTDRVLCSVTNACVNGATFCF